MARNDSTQIERHAIPPGTGESVDLGSLSVDWKIENYFREIAAVFADAQDGEPDLARFAETNERYELEMDFESVPLLCERFSLRHPMLEQSTSAA